MDYSVLEQPREWMPNLSEVDLYYPLHEINHLVGTRASFDTQAMLAQAIAFHQNGDLSAAQDIYRKIIESDPDHADALHLSGVVAYQIGKYSIAISMIIRAIRNCPANPYYHTNLGTVFQAVEQYEKAIQCYQKAIDINPDYAEAYYNMGNVLVARNEYEKAIHWYRNVLRILPNHLDAVYNMANCYKKLEQYHQAIDFYTKAIRINPDHSASHNNMGNAYMALNKKKKAAGCYKRALKIFPDFPEALYNLAQTYQRTGRVREALSLYQKALEHNPAYAAAYNNLGNIFQDLGMVNDAILCFQKALSAQPEFLEALNNMGNCFKDMGEIDKALRCYRTVLDINPDFIAAHSNLLYCMNFQEGQNAKQLFQQHQAWALQHTSTLKRIIPLKGTDQSSDKHLRIGYISPDFRQHPVTHFIEPLITGHDRSSFTIYCYSDVDNSDPATERIKSGADAWRDIAGESDQRVAEQIQKDSIDILIDLAGHTANNRLTLFARKPALIQISYLGYPNTTGISEMDYRITDSWADPPGKTDHLYSEKLLRLPSGFLCFTADEAIPVASETPSCRSGRITYGSFNQPAKITHEVIRVWSEILSRVQHSQLVLKSKIYCDTMVQKWTRDQFVEYGIMPERIKLLEHHLSHAEHLNSYQHIDIGLDPFPYNGATTTCEALWMGVPVIVLAGESHVSRVGVSLLNSIGRPELIADSMDEYIQKSVSLGNDPTRIQEYRNRLRSAMRNSGLTDRKTFCASFEKILKKIWQKSFLT